MSTIALGSFKGSPGTTTAALCLAATWPSDVLLVEADPAGGDLVTRFDALDPAVGLVPVGAGARREVPSDLIAANAQRVSSGRNGGIEVLVGVDHHSQARALEGSWANIMEALLNWHCDVLIDVGRLLPDLSGGARAILERADLFLIVMRATLDAALRVKNNLAEVTSQARDIGLLVVGNGYSTSEIESVLGIEVAGRLPIDDKGARLVEGRIGGSPKSPLVRHAAKVATSLAQRQGSATTADMAAGRAGLSAAIPKADDTRSTSRSANATRTSDEIERAPRRFVPRSPAPTGVGGTPEKERS